MPRPFVLVLSLSLGLLGCEDTKPAATDAKLTPDTRASEDTSRTSDGRPDQAGRDAAKDGPTTDRKAADGSRDTGATFACGALLSCATASEYCEKFTGGACGGPAPSDAGVCPPNCNLTTCPGGQQVCLCQTFTCKPLPAGCSSCSCVGAAASCSCSQPGAGGPIQVHCMAP